ncbi:DNA methyltransferase [Acidithiobacillus thiooxidans]|uniref:DNA methyltransferase n=1 Tax=Acidithiobacillus thiooxidans TaxID=930 RepID=UPI00285D28BD|nr:DNA methyltransferase [Acidithiobacillus thiooxidans]MDR7927242.1 DNA methyltransferase [Acidithiobacillus thiooxidans]
MTTLIRKAIYTREDEDALVADGCEWNFHNEETKEHIHSLHPYPAKFIPQIPRRAIELWTEPGDIVYDPFNGCGTTILEASIAGRHGIGTDNNAVAILASRAKAALYSKTDLDALGRFATRIKGGLDFAASRPDLIPSNKNFHYWFDPAIIARLAALKGLILAENEPVRTLLLAVFSSIIVRVSYQDSDTRYSRILRKVAADEVDKAFGSRLTDTIARIPDAMVPGRVPVDVVQADARSVPFIADGSVSLIVTSPPYLNSYDYHKYHRQRLHWIGDEGSVEFARDREIGSHDEFTRHDATPEGYFEDMGACFAEWTRVLKKGGSCLIVVGDSIVSKQAVHVGDKFVDMLVEHGLSYKKRWIRTLHSTKRAFNVKNSRISHEHVLLLVKP